MLNSKSDQLKAAFQNLTIPFKHGILE